MSGEHYCHVNMDRNLFFKLFVQKRTNSAHSVVLFHVDRMMF